jgi:hypothetical protein
MEEFVTHANRLAFGSIAVASGVGAGMDIDDGKLKAASRFRIWIELVTFDTQNTFQDTVTFASNDCQCRHHDAYLLFGSGTV